MRPTVFFTGLLLLAGARGAVASEPQVYDLPACIQAALHTSADLSAAAADLAGARARLAEAQAGRYGQGEYTQFLGFVNQAHGDPTFSPDDKNAVFTGLGPFTRLNLDINIPLWTFGKLDAALKAAQDALDSERAHTEVRRAEVILNTKQLYYGLLLTRQLSGVLHDMLDVFPGKKAKFVKNFMEGTGSVQAAVEAYVKQVKAGKYPGAEHSF